MAAWEALCLNETVQFELLDVWRCLKMFARIWWHVSVSLCSFAFRSGNLGPDFLQCLQWQLKTFQGGVQVFSRCSWTLSHGSCGRRGISSITVRHVPLCDTWSARSSDASTVYAAGQNASIRFSHIAADCWRNREPDIRTVFWRPRIMFPTSPRNLRVCEPVLCWHFNLVQSLWRNEGALSAPLPAEPEISVLSFAQAMVFLFLGASVFLYFKIFQVYVFGCPDRSLRDSVWDTVTIRKAKQKLFM
jgi:hypothetical protein